MVEGVRVVFVPLVVVVVVELSERANKTCQCDENVGAFLVPPASDKLVGKCAM